MSVEELDEKHAVMLSVCGQGAGHLISCSMDSKGLLVFEYPAQEASWCRVLQRGNAPVSLPEYAWNWGLTPALAMCAGHHDQPPAVLS